MARVLIQADFTNKYEISASNTTYVLEESVSGRTGASPSIEELAGVSNNTIFVKGELESQNYGVATRGTNTNIIVSDTGFIGGDNGIATLGSGSYIENNGLISCTNAGIVIFNADSHIVNNGIISAPFGILFTTAGLIENYGRIYGGSQYAIRLSGDGSICRLGDTSVVTADVKGVSFYSTDGQKLHLSNAGLIATAGAITIDGGSGSEFVRNTGTIRGAVILGADDDVFDNRGGIFRDNVDGGTGNDTFIVDSTKTGILELTTGGTDTVKSTVSLNLSIALYLAQEIENIVLLGIGNINGAGNELANTITGNSGNNRLSGLAGGDTFLFLNNNGRDFITDFDVANDTIDLSKYLPINNLNDLKNHHVKVTDGDLVIFAADDEIRLDHVTRSDLRHIQFDF